MQKWTVIVIRLVIVRVTYILHASINNILLIASYSNNFLCYRFIFFILQVLVTSVRGMEACSIIKVATHCMNFIHFNDSAVGTNFCINNYWHVET